MIAIIRVYEWYVCTYTLITNINNEITKYQYDRNNLFVCTLSLSPSPSLSLSLSLPL